MTPRFSPNHLKNSANADPELSGQLGIAHSPGRVAGANLAHGLFRQFSFRATGAFRRSAFTVPVCGVVRLRSQKKMVRSHTGRIIAAVQDAQPIRYRTEGQFPGGVRGERGTADGTESGVAVPGFRSGPEPAALRLGKRPPKAILPSSSLVGATAADATEPLSLFDLGVVSSKDFSALLAGQIDRMTSHREPPIPGAGGTAAYDGASLFL
jgi:hypothetical protein